jgi:hypothetical protein
MSEQGRDGNHPVHPAFVTLRSARSFSPRRRHRAHGDGLDFWYQFPSSASGRASSRPRSGDFGFVDYFGVRMSAHAEKLATIHMVINLCGVVLYAFNFLLRRNGAALHTNRWPWVFGLELITFAALGVSGWIGGDLSYEHKVGVVEWTDEEANEIGRQERRTTKVS